MMAKYLKMAAGGSDKPKFSDLPVVNFPTSFSEIYNGVSAADLPYGAQPLALSDNFAAYWYMETDDTTNLKVRSGSDQHSVILPFVLETVGFDDTRSLMFTSSSDDVIRFYDVSDLANGMPLLSTIPSRFTDYFVLNGQYLYLNRYVYDITNPASPVSLGLVGNYVFGVHSSGNYVIAFSYFGGFRVLDVSSSPLGVEVASTLGPVGGISRTRIQAKILKSTNDRVAIIDTDEGQMHISALNWVDPLNPITQFPRKRLKFYFEDIELDERRYQNLISQSGDLGYLAQWDALVFDLTASELTFIYKGDISAGNVNYAIAASGNRVLFQPILDGATVYGPTTSLNTNPDF